MRTFPSRLAARAAFATFAAVASLAAPQAAFAQPSNYPAKPIRFLVPFTVGGAADVLARMIGQKLAESWGQQVVVENRGGASGTIAMVAFRQMPADGYNFSLISNSVTAAQVIYPKLSYDIIRDFAPVSLIANSPMMIAVKPSLPAKNLAELLADVKRNPGKLTYGSCGVGGTMHLAMEAVKFHTQSFIVHAPYRGCSVAVADMISGQLDIVVASSPAVLPHMKSGKLRTLAVTNTARTPSAPDVPTVAESGVPGLKGVAVDNWYGFIAPLGTPKEIVDRFAGEVARLMNEPDMRARMLAAGLDQLPGSAAELTRLMESDVREFRKIVDFAKILPE